ncbi:hypothetical protein CKQ80_26980 [Pseudomonas moraviensis]|uniref:DUF4123 domain-containing protein n=1 Tax=Pseudomonas moraviensis TaxID=321662 RepID=A0A2A2PU88_9PSED|nr:DUF4123 domain-containing protein [Pseudomonas moraviensis]PAW49054.1 hypothetical protein CKQ68_16845 [Pseudomonas moraviensis]PAW58781.1 hypothetical protein CKQ80_26980 [Pseudomonas moraviensis]
MHVKALSALLEAPRYAFEGLPKESSDLSLCFIIDRIRQSEAMSRLYRVGEPVDTQGLFLNTDFAEIAADGPLWLVAPWGSRLAAEAASLCEENFAGIALTTADPAKALAHARWLLRANDGSGGQSLLSYHKPSLWAALAYTAGESSHQLFGPWQHVYSPAPVHFGRNRGRWLSWRALSELEWLGDVSAFNLPPAAPKVQEHLGWVYWADEQYAAYGEPTDEQLPNLVENLNVLVTHNIYEGRHLLKLGQITNGPLLETQPQAMAILQSREESFIKVQQLQQLANSAA